MSLAPVPTEQDRTLCPNCSAPLAPDQRYCLACGQPASPVRLAFLDVLQTDAALGQGSPPVGLPPASYPSMVDPGAGPEHSLRRYSGLFGLLAVLLLSILTGLLVGHWVTQDAKAPSAQIVKVEGLGALASAPAASTGATSTGATATGAAKSATPAHEEKVSAQTEAKEATEARKIAKALPPKAVKVTSTKLQKLGNTTGKKHEQEINSLGAQPIETGG
ncbi:MAG TPA: zinc ribbon domain-containing protein [Solirubrobacteraceae bacterium]|nr:zinc ribbon domain-containing protein [Solirubrobacteraceae bacterium]